jgi:hypothetical protein
MCVAGFNSMSVSVIFECQLISIFDFRFRVIYDIKSRVLIQVDSESLPIAYLSLLFAP